jgi:hypothetical protein
MELFEFIVSHLGIERISLVEKPAIEVDFVALSKPEFFKEVKKGILIGPALIPDKPIYREKDGEGYYGYFSKETIDEISQLYMKLKKQGEWNVEHDQMVDGVSVIESWIIEGENDKSKDYGFDLPVGTWMIKAKVDNEELKNEAISTGKLRGFSIEGHFELKHVEKQIFEAVEKRIEKEIEDQLIKRFDKFIY